MNDIVEYIRQRLREYDSTLDVRPGSALSDLLINPAAAILYDLKNQQDEIFKNQTLADPETMAIASLESFAKSFLVDRDLGTKATGYVKLYFTTLKDIVIPKGTTFQSKSGLKYLTTQGYTFSSNDLAVNDDQYPYYSTGDIYIEAENAGLLYEADPGTITKIVSTLNINPAYVSNPAAITGSADDDTNDSLYTKILNAAINKTLYSNIGISLSLKEQFSTIQDVKVIGMNNPKMQRDIVYSYNLSSGLYVGGLYEKSDYFGAIGPLSSGYIYSGILSSPFYHFYPFNESICYANGVYSSGLITSGFLSDNVSPSYFIGREISLEQYAGMYKKDSSYATFETRIILEENFNNSDLQLLGWWTSDATAGRGKLRHANEIVIASGQAILGYSAPSSTPDSVNIVVDQNFLIKISGLIDRAVQL